MAVSCALGYPGSPHVAKTNLWFWEWHQGMHNRIQAYRCAHVDWLLYYLASTDSTVQEVSAGARNAARHLLTQNTNRS
ncbi:hypothetical protein IAQ61_004648 [Plenodomus lingam]|uniref:uncharacterized protein n=1 Tax=Leptosphaeria maculans TaxID=5022 RepID=UPI00332A26AD|nr:hypothetical protein IAQ61_004648 [Plenodomus lingam]